MLSHRTRALAEAQSTLPRRAERASRTREFGCRVLRRLHPPVRVAADPRASATGHARTPPRAHASSRESAPAGPRRSPPASQRCSSNRSATESRRRSAPRFVSPRTTSVSRVSIPTMVTGASTCRAPSVSRTSHRQCRPHLQRPAQTIASDATSASRDYATFTVVGDEGAMSGAPTVVGGTCFALFHAASSSGSFDNRGWRMAFSNRTAFRPRLT